MRASAARSVPVRVVRGGARDGGRGVVGCAAGVEGRGRGEAHGVLLALGVQRRRHGELEADCERRGDEEEAGDGRGPRHVPMSKASPIWLRLAPRPSG